MIAIAISIIALALAIYAVIQIRKITHIDGEKTLYNEK